MFFGVSSNQIISISRIIKRSVYECALYCNIQERNVKLTSLPHSVGHFVGNVIRRNMHCRCMLNNTEMQININLRNPSQLQLHSKSSCSNLLLYQQLQWHCNKINYHYGFENIADAGRGEFSRVNFSGSIKKLLRNYI